MHDGGARRPPSCSAGSGRIPTPPSAAAGAVVSRSASATSRRRGPRSSVDASGPPTSTARAARSLAEGLLLTLDAAYPAAIARLAQSMTEQRLAVVTPDTAGGARHAGRRCTAATPCAPAASSAGPSGGTGDDEGFVDAPAPAAARLGPHAGRSAAAAAAADAAAIAGAHLHRRDALWAAALQTGDRPPQRRQRGGAEALVRRDGGAHRVLRWTSTPCCRSASCGWPPPACTRSTCIEPAVDEAFDLLERAWQSARCGRCRCTGRACTPGILANSPESVAPHGQALTAAAGHSPFARALATAGRTWLRVLANHVDVDEVTAAARSLTQFGLTWDATRLASQAALQTPDGRVSGAMLQLARDLKLRPPIRRRRRGRRRRHARRRPRHRNGCSPMPRVVAAVRPGARGRRAAAAGHALPRHRQPALHLGEDRRTPRGAHPAPAGRRVAVGVDVDAAGDPRRAELTIADVGHRSAVSANVTTATRVGHDVHDGERSTRRPGNQPVS